MFTNRFSIPVTLALASSRGCLELALKQRIGICPETGEGDFK
ncbi:MAG: hypothetical protein N2A42_00930 [Luteolibacter sp.]